MSRFILLVFAIVLPINIIFSVNIRNPNEIISTYAFGIVVDTRLNSDGSKNFQFIASIEKKGKHWCGAVIFTTKAIITAAHCTSKQKVSDLRIRINSLQREKGGQLHSVSHYVIHPTYKEFYRQYFGLSEGDLAIIFLKDEIQLSSLNQNHMIRLPNNDPVSSKDYIVSGWGGFKDKPMDVLKYAKINIWSKDECEDLVKDIDTQLCGIAVNSNEGHCKGDSGGPLTLYKNHKTYLIGIVSGIVNGCANKDSFLFYTNVYPFKDWIMKTINSGK